MQIYISGFKLYQHAKPRLTFGQSLVLGSVDWEIKDIKNRDIYVKKKKDRDTE